MLGVVGLAVLVLGGHSVPAVPCSVRDLRESPGYLWRIERVEANVDSATRIVRVRAVAADSVAHTMSFEPLEWIRGTASTERLVLPGTAVDEDDFNTRPVPYRTVRPSGQRRSCNTEEYRIGAQYLLLLRDGTGFSPLYWWPLGPVNEQLRGDNDLWLAWVRAHVAARKSSHH